MKYLDINLLKQKLKEFHSKSKHNSALIIYMGHGTNNGKLMFNDCSFGENELNELKKNGIDTSILSGMFIFACFGSIFAKNLGCSWISFDKEVLSEAPKAYMHRLIQF